MAEQPELDEDLLRFLTPDARTDVKSVALMHLLDLTGSTEGQTYIVSKPKLTQALFDLLNDENNSITKTVFLILINLSSEPIVCSNILERHKNFPGLLLSYILESSSPHADLACIVGSNLTRDETGVNKFIEAIFDRKSEIGFSRIVSALRKVDYNAGSNLNYLAAILANLTQDIRTRLAILDHQERLMQSLLACINFAKNTTRRAGLVRAIRNCCFETEHHAWLISDEVDILPHVLLPLAGPEELTDEETAKLPPELQYLEPTKEREPNPEIRAMLVETLHQICSKLAGREHLRDRNAYVILREFHKSETDENVSKAIFNIVDVLLADENGIDNIRDINIVVDEKQ